MGLIAKVTAWRLQKQKTKEKKAETIRWQNWYSTHVHYKATYINNIFKQFKYVIRVDPDKFMDVNEPFGWVANKDARAYFYPQRELGSNCVWRIERASNFDDGQGWYVDELGGQDMVFVASNNQEDITMIALQWG
jgi:hypothetical protein